MSLNESGFVEMCFSCVWAIPVLPFGTVFRDAVRILCRWENKKGGSRILRDVSVFQ